MMIFRYRFNLCFRLSASRHDTKAKMDDELRRRMIGI